MKRLALAISLAAISLTGCSKAATTDTTVAGTDTTISSQETTTSTPATTTSVAAKPSTSGTQKALVMAAINGTTFAAVTLNDALLQKGGWAAKPVTSSTTPAVVQKRSTREAAILLSTLQSNPPKGFTVTAFGSEGIVAVYDGASVTAKDLTGLVEYLEVSSKGASVCLRPSIDGNKDAAQTPVTNDGYRSLPVGKLVQPANDGGWIILLRTAQKGACRLSLDTLGKP